MSSWLLIAAESREFAGILKRASRTKVLDWPGTEFVREIEWAHGSWILAANGPGRTLAAQTLASRPETFGIMSVGFAGALHPALRIGDIVVSEEFPGRECPGAIRGRVLSADRVAVSRAEKRKLWEESGAAVVEMEADAISQKAREWGLPFCCVKAVSDTAEEDMPLDFNLYRDSAGRFSRSAIALAALKRPFRLIPKLRRLDRNCRIAAESLGEFLAHCQI